MLGVRSDSPSQFTSTTITDTGRSAVRQCLRIGAAWGVPASRDGPRSCPKPVFGPGIDAKSLFRNTFRLSPYSPKTWRKILP